MQGLVGNRCLHTLTRYTMLMICWAKSLVSANKKIKFAQTEERSMCLKVTVWAKSSSVNDSLPSRTSTLPLQRTQEIIIARSRVARRTENTRRRLSDAQ